MKILVLWMYFGGANGPRNILHHINRFLKFSALGNILNDTL